MYDDFRGGVAVRNVNRSTPIFPSQPRIPPQQPSPSCLLFPQLFVPSVSSISCAYYGEEERYSRNELCSCGSGRDAVADAGRIVVVEGEEGIMRISEC